MLSDAVTSIKAYLYERAVSPLLGSLIISWCAWNYKFLLLLVSGLTFSEKLRFTHVLYSNDYEIFLQGMLFPFLTSVAYLFIFPYPAQFVYKFSLRRQKALNDLKNEQQENELLTLEQSKAIRNQLAEVEKQFDELVERKERAIEQRDREIEELKAQVDLITNQREVAQQELRDLSSQLDEKIEDSQELIFESYQNNPSNDSLGDSHDVIGSPQANLQSEAVTYVNKPSYIRFYENLDAGHQELTKMIMTKLLNASYTFEELHMELPYEALIGDDLHSLTSLIGKLKLYDILTAFDVDLSVHYQLGDAGKELYKHLLEQNFKPDVVA